MEPTDMTPSDNQPEASEAPNPAPETLPPEATTEKVKETVTEPETTPEPSAPEASAPAVADSAAPEASANPETPSDAKTDAVAETRTDEAVEAPEESTEASAPSPEAEAPNAEEAGSAEVTESADQSPEAEQAEAAAPEAKTDAPEAKADEAVEEVEAAPPEPEKTPEEIRDERELRHFEEVVEFRKVKRILGRLCASSLGSDVVERMRFLTSADAIDTCLKQTSEMVNLVAQHGRLPLAGIHNASGMIQNALSGGRPLGGKELLKIQSTIEAGAEFIDMLKDQDEAYPKLCSLVQHLDPLTNITNQIRKILHGNGKVRDDASPKLYDFRRKMESLRGKIENLIQNFTRNPEIQKHLQNPHPTQRNGRHVLAIKAEQRRHVPGILHDRSKTGSTVYIEPDPIVALGNELQDIAYDESAEITRILWAITQTVANSYSDIERVTKTLAWIDFTHAKARLTKRYDLHCAETSEREFELRKLRHMLLVDQALKLKEEGQEQPKIVSSTTRLGHDFDMLVLTGPNTGGKTVLLKAIGLAALMHQCGLPVPAEDGSKLPIFKRLYADIGDEQSIQQNLSTFSGHITHMKDFLAGACSETLILVDELGAGTDPQEGAALGRAMLDSLLDSRALSLVTTHLGSLKDFAFQRPRAENGAMAFDMVTLSPTYELYVGQPGSSNALEIAARLDVPKEILDKAREILEGEDTSSNDLINEIQKVRLENEKIRDRLLSDEEKTKSELKAATDEREAAQALKTVISREANLEMTERFSRLRTAIKSIKEDLKGEKKDVIARMNAFEKEIDELLYHTPYEEKRRRFAEHLKKGDEVYVISFDKVARIERINKERKEIYVNLNGLPIKTKFSNVSWIEGAQNRAAARFEMAQTRSSGKNWRGDKDSKPSNSSGAPRRESRSRDDNRSEGGRNRGRGRGGRGGQGGGRGGQGGSRGSQGGRGQGGRGQGGRGGSSNDRQGQQSSRQEARR